jgi:valyl-tRNA synthetase
MEKAYSPASWEDSIYRKWEESGCFNPDNLDLAEDAPNYSMVLPPPNITAKLHIGHSSVIAIEDLFIRYHRMKGYRTLWIPGTDHAAIATQNVVEKKLFEEEGKTRHDFEKEDFLEKVWDFLRETQSTILDQTKKMGASIDWSREAFTLDEDRQKAVRRMFVDMYKEGIIYRGERVINWCPRCKSTLSDDELEYKEQKAAFYTFKYSPEFPLSISTTRPETKLADTGIAVNPKDERYQRYIGQEIETDFCGQKLKLKIVADKGVDMDFGTGALGLTPAHSMTDWEIARRENLKIIPVIDEDGKIKEGFSDFSGKTSLEARQMIIKKLKESSLISKEEEIDNNISLCYRCKSPIEPLTSKQWFVDVNKKLKRLGDKSLKERATEAVREKEIEFIPHRFSKVYSNWMENLHDWCISRQILFGHQIPVWYRGDQVHVGEEAPSEEGWEQDPDTLDTWFSSGMWTFSTLGWPDNYKNGEKTGDLKKYHPTQMLETGYEIISLWVSRMIMMSFFALQEIPFEKVYLNGMVLDKKGKKMSKSAGNGIDPLEMKKEFGADALRLSLLIGNTPGNDVKMSEEKIATSRNFVNKLWNISRFIISKNESFSSDYNKESLSLSDKWILSRLNKTIIESTDDLNNYSFSSAGEKIKNFTWNDLADWYLEAKKFEEKDNQEKILSYILKTILKLWHPFIPFVTEVIWSKIEEKELLITSPWPEKEDIDFNSEEKDFEIIKNAIISIRNARLVNKIEAGKKIKALILKSENDETIKKQEHLIKNLKTGIEKIEFISDRKELPKENVIPIIVEKIEIYLIGAIDEEKEKARQEKEREKLEKIINISEKKLSNDDFVEKAPAELVEKEREKLKKYKTELKKINI